MKEEYPCSIQRLVLVLLFLISNVRHAHLGSNGDDQFAKSHLKLAFWRKKGTP